MDIRADHFYPWISIHREFVFFLFADMNGCCGVAKTLPSSPSSSNATALLFVYPSTLFKPVIYINYRHI